MNLLSVVGALISRWHGGGFFRISKAWISIIWALPFAYLVGTYNSWLVLPALTLCALGKSTGHGNWFDLATMPQGTRERLEFIIRPLYNRIPEYWYDVLGLAITGLAAVSGGLLILPYSPVGAALIMACGLIKALCYMVGRWIRQNKDNPEATEVGEYLTGFFAYLSITIILLNNL